MTITEKIKKPINILIIDDDATSRLILSKFLQNYNANVVCAENGEIGVNLYKKYKNFDAVISDCEMPVMSGPKALGMIRDTDRNLGTCSALFVITGKEREEMISLFSNLDISEYFQKPVDHVAVYKTIMSHLLE